MAYKTGNPVGSTDPRDLFDNAGIIDQYVNGTQPFYPDRFGVQRISLSGQRYNYNQQIEGQAAQFAAAQAQRATQFQQFLTDSAYVSLGNYAAGIEVAKYNEYVAYGGNFYRPAPGSVPFTTSGTWEGADEDLFVLFDQDGALRQDLGSSTEGAALVARSSVNVTSADELRAIPSLSAAGFATLVLPSGAPVFYYRDPSDTTTADDGVMTLVGSGGSRWKMNHNGTLSVLSCGAAGDGSTDDSEPFATCATLCQANDLVMHVPAVSASYLVATGLSLSRKLNIRGDDGSTPNVYAGRQTGGSRVNYTGSGDLFAWDSQAEDPAQTTVTGSSVEDLLIFGTGSAKHGVRVGKPEDIGNDQRVRSNFTIKNVYVGGFTKGYGVRLTWCFSNTFENLVVQNCAVDASLNYAHGTRFIGGNLEQSLMALDCRTSYAVDVSGTVIQGIHASRAPIFDMAMPDDLLCWSAGWDGTGATGALRNVPSAYAGVAVRNIGSALNLNDVYWEVNDYNLITELDSFTTIRGGILAVDTETRSFVQIGIGGLVVDDVLVQYNAPTGFQGLFQTERSYASPCHIGPGVSLPTSLPANMVFTGRTEFVGSRTQNMPLAFGAIKESRNTFEYSDRLSIANVSGTSTINFGAPLSNKLSAVSTGGTVTVGASMPASINKPGARVSLHLICTGATTVNFGSTFRPVAASYSMGANTQILMDFEYSNGQWIAANTPVSLTL